MLEFKEKVGKLKGSVHIARKNTLTGQYDHTYIDNLEVDLIYTGLARMLGGDFALAYDINRVSVGTGTTPATAADTTITFLTPAAVWLATTVTYPTSYSVKFTATWAVTESRDEDITELGLFARNGSLMARVVFPAMKKSTYWEWVVEWTLTYEAAYTS